MDFNKPQNNNSKKSNDIKKNEETEKTSLEFRETEFLEDDLSYYDYLIELPLFPHDFTHHTGSNGLKEITNEEINMWIEECIIALESDKSESYATAQAGDTKLIVLRIYDYEDSESYRYYVEIFKERFSIEIYPEEL